jgi:small subunit ribosomal protein S13e
VTATQVIDQIVKSAKKGLTPSQIGVILRDSHGIAQVKSVTGNKILRILKTQGIESLMSTYTSCAIEISNLPFRGHTQKRVDGLLLEAAEYLTCSGLAPEIPEDLYCLIKKAVSVRKHLERNRKDKDSKFRLILIESRVHRLGRYYKKVGKLPPNWR